MLSFAPTYPCLPFTLSPPSHRPILAVLTATSTGRRQAPALFARTTARGVPLPALLATASVSLLCVASAYVGGGVLWGWLQTLVGVSNQVRRCPAPLPAALATGRCGRWTATREKAR